MDNPNLHFYQLVDRYYEIVGDLIPPLESNLCDLNVRKMTKCEINDTITEIVDASNYIYIHLDEINQILKDLKKIRDN